MTRRPWQTRLRSDVEQRHERAMTWPELVYDLVFVVAIAALAVRLEGEIGVPEVVRFSLLLIPVWWVWMGVALANDRFAGDKLGLCVLTFVNLLPAAALALTIEEATGERATGFTIAYITARALVIGQWFRAGRLDPAARPLTTRLAMGSALALLPWLLSLAVPAPQRYALWALGLTIDLVTPLTTLGIQAELPRLNAERLMERYRLFTIIVLGEAVAGAVRGASESERLPLLSGALALALAFALGWALFDGPLRTHAPTITRQTATGYLLLPLVGGLTALGAGITDVVTHGDSTPSSTMRWLLCGAVALTLATMSVLELLQNSPGAISRAALRISATVIALVIGLLGGGLDAVALLGCLALVAIVQTMLGILPYGEALSTTATESPV